MLINTSCNAPCNLSSGEAIAEQGADRLKEQTQQLEIQQQQQELQSDSVKVESTQSVPQPHEVTPETVSARVNQYQDTPKTPFDTMPPQAVGSLINIQV